MQRTPLIGCKRNFDKWMTCYFNRLLDLETELLYNQRNQVGQVFFPESPPNDKFFCNDSINRLNSNFDNWMTCYFNRLLDLEYRYARQSTQSGGPGILPGK